MKNGIDYQPKPPFDVDLRPLGGDELKHGRRQLVATAEEFEDQGRCEFVYPLQRHMSKRIGVTLRLYHAWEQNGVSTSCWAAICREVICNGADIDIVPAPPGEVCALGAVLGAKGLAELVGYEPQTISRYTRTQAPIQGGVGPLFHWLFEECGLEERDRIPNHSNARFHPWEIREMRRRRDAGESYQSIADDYDTGSSHVCQIYHRKLYASVG
ncbi:MAG: hypothetical protein U5L04_02470 [Trueperaceae bacterium]|nr:hypothetical protein [Trueperaceae bacterium]